MAFHATVLGSTRQKVSRRCPGVPTLQHRIENLRQELTRVGMRNPSELFGRPRINDLPNPIAARVRYGSFSAIHSVSARNSDFGYKVDMSNKSLFADSP